MGTCCSIDIENIIKENPVYKMSYKYRGKIKITNKPYSKSEERFLKRNFEIKRVDKINTEDDSLYSGELRKVFNYEKIYADYIDNNGDKWVMHGKGYYLIPKNFIFEGSFDNGYPNGYGKIFDLNENIICEGNFLNDYLDGYGIENNNYFWYKGNYINGLKNGDGIYIDKLFGCQYEGNFINDIFHGEGKIKYSNKTIKGEWNNGNLLDNFKLLN